MASDEVRRKALLEAVDLCGDVFLSCRAAQIPMEEFNKWYNNEPEFHDNVDLRELDGRKTTERIETMRKIVEKWDEAMVILRRKADEFRKYEDARLRDSQLNLL